jgi:leucyl-tRNA synthetase
MDYNFSEIENKWQQFWSAKHTFKAENFSPKPKYYVLDMFPYPSGAGLHVGHPLGYIASDIIARYKRHEGFNVLHPMGYDAFGLPAEQYAIQTGQHPAITTEKNIKRYRKQLDQMGFSFDWSREVRTYDPDYYKWTQIIFCLLFDAWYDQKANKARPIAELMQHFENNGTQALWAATESEFQFSALDWQQMTDLQQQEILLQYRLAYRSESMVNWCPALGTVLANDEVKDGRSERGGHPVVQKKMMQWSLRISAYAQRLLDGLNEIDWTESLKEAQRNWIGRSDGAKLWFQLQNHEGKVEVFTTRPDTLFGVSFLTLAPEHPLVSTIVTEAQKGAVEAYQVQAALRSERERMADTKTVSGCFTGAYAVHPFTGAPIPVWIGDYVLAGYGTGAVMGVPGHDTRDYAFAKHFQLPIVEVVQGGNLEEAAFDSYDGILVNSDFLDGLQVSEAKKLMIETLEAREIGMGKVNYRLRDAVFGRQRYWGEPIPVYFKDGLPQLLEKAHLPLELPEVDAYLPTEAGEPPLARAKGWFYNPKNGQIGEQAPGFFPIETTTMPGWAGSSWYFLRYMDPQNQKDFASPEAEQYWRQVDLYIGGSEHATGHLLYARFWQKVLFDLGLVSAEEPFKKLINQGMIGGVSALVHRIRDQRVLVSAGLASEYDTSLVHIDVALVQGTRVDVAGLIAQRTEFQDFEFVEEAGEFHCVREVEKMSKSKFNVVNPDEIVANYGADTLRMYEMFLGPLEQHKPWSTEGISGVFNFLRKFWRLFHPGGQWGVKEDSPTPQMLKSLHKTIKKVKEDLNQFSFNTSVSAFMICVNELTEQKCANREILEPLTLLLSPFAPHIAEELWEKLGHSGGISKQPFPVFDAQYLVEHSFSYPVSFNGKMRFKLDLPLDLDREAIVEKVLADDRTAKYTDGKGAKKIIVVPGKIINLVV